MRGIGGKGDGGGNRQCRDGVACTMPSCKFDHPPGRRAPPPPAVTSGGKGGGISGKGGGGGNRQCRDGVACSMPSCKFDHLPGRRAHASPPAVTSGGKGGGISGKGGGGGNRQCCDGVACSTPSCKFDHPPGRRAHASSAADVDNELRSSAPNEFGAPFCHDDLNCLNPSCYFTHSAQRPKVCYAAGTCADRACPNIHPWLSTENTTLGLAEVRNLVEATVRGGKKAAIGLRQVLTQCGLVSEGANDSRVASATKVAHRLTQALRTHAARMYDARAEVRAKLFAASNPNLSPHALALLRAEVVQ
jgi:hypothetical protein